jgi:hypothetical protein
MGLSNNGDGMKKSGTHRPFTVRFDAESRKWRIIRLNIEELVQADFPVILNVIKRCLVRAAEEAAETAARMLESMEAKKS